MKTCTKCGEVKALGEYHKDADSKDGLVEMCKVCACAKSRAYNAANKESIAAYGKSTRARSRNVRRLRVAKDPEAHKARRSALRKARIDERLAREAASRKRLKQKDPEKVQAQTRRANLRRFGITPDAYDTMLAAQGGNCRICGNKNSDHRGRRLHVDHDHSTGAVRGLLCSKCNTGLGLFNNDVVLLIAAAQYVGLKL